MGRYLDYDWNMSPDTPLNHPHGRVTTLASEHKIRVEIQPPWNGGLYNKLSYIMYQLQCKYDIVYYVGEVDDRYYAGWCELAVKTPSEYLNVLDDLMPMLKERLSYIPADSWKVLNERS